MEADKARFAVALDMGSDRDQDTSIRSHKSVFDEEQEASGLPEQGMRLSFQDVTYFVQNRARYPGSVAAAGCTRSLCSQCWVCRQTSGRSWPS